MMRKIRDFFTTAIVGGMVVVLPIALIAFAFKWLFSLIYSVTESLANSAYCRSLSRWSGLHYDGAHRGCDVLYWFGG